MQFLQNSLVELITQTSTNLPPDVRAAMAAAGLAEKPHTQASQALNIIFTNVDMAAEEEGAICQDTGMPTFVVHTPVGVNQIEIRRAIKAAVAEATKRGKLRPNSVDSLTGENSGNNLGEETPVIHFEQWEQDDIEVKLVLKGGGCENKNIQYSLPANLDHLGRADRNLEGVRKCLLHAVWQAQGQGCAPGAIGVCIGSDRAHGYDLAKMQLFRTLDDINPDPDLAKLEAEVMERSQQPRRRRHGLWRPRLPHRLQDRRCQPPARQLLRFRSLQLLGVPPPRRAPRSRNRRHHPVALSRSRTPPGTHDAERRLSAHWPRDRAHPAAHRRSRPRPKSR